MTTFKNIKVGHLYYKYGGDLKIDQTFYLITGKSKDDKTISAYEIGTGFINHKNEIKEYKYDIKDFRFLKSGLPLGEKKDYRYRLIKRVFYI